MLVWMGMGVWFVSAKVVGRRFDWEGLDGKSFV